MLALIHLMFYLTIMFEPKITILGVAQDLVPS